jgi:transposase
MTMTAICTQSIPAGTPILYVAFELGAIQWKLGFSTGLGVAVRLRTVGAGNLAMLRREIELAKKKFRLADDVPLCSCYEAGRDGFWLHRWLVEQGISSIIVDAASIEVNRRYRRKKTDSLDVAKLVAMLIRHHAGEKLWSVVRVPSREDEQRRHLHRDLEEMKGEAAQHCNRIRGLLAGVGARIGEINASFLELLPTVKTADGRAVPGELRERLLREFERLQFVEQQIRSLERHRNQKLRDGDQEEYVAKARKLMQLRAIGPHSALTPTPYDSGEDKREQGISKAGNRRLRMVEIGWCWLQYQKSSTLSLWYQKRFAGGGKRQKKIGIVALARKLLIALWKYLERDEVPEGAVLVNWRSKLIGLGAQPLPS